MADLVVISWRSIPAQVVARAGRRTVKRELPARFAEAIDMAAMRGGARESEAYLEGWHRAAPVPCGDDLEAAVAAEVERLDRTYDDQRLKRLVAAGGAEPEAAAADEGDVLAVFTPSGKRGRFARGTDLLSAARALAVDLDSVCGGRGICGRCQIVPVPGEHLKHGIAMTAESLTAPGAVEARYAEKRGALAPGRRLGCQAKLCGDALVDVPEDAQVHRQVVRKSPDERAVAVDPPVTLHTVDVARPDMHDPRSDARRLAEALAAEWAIAEARFPLAVLASLQAALRAGDWRVTVAVRRRRDIVAVYPGLVERVYGLAVDIGSTTIAAHLTDMADGRVAASAGVMNPQIRFGEDLMSRVSHVMMNPGGAGDLTSAVRGALDGLAGTLAAEAGIGRERIVEVAVAGNPVMHHLFLGLDPTELGGAPFALTLDQGYDVAAREVGLVLAPAAMVYCLPCIAGHVGADTAAAILAEAPHLDDGLTLLVDVGTNAEIVLGGRDRLLACSSPTGPAFEGAQIGCGQRAAPGAIERVRIDASSLEPRYKVIGCDLWSDEPGFEEAVRRTGVTGICGSGIIEVLAEMYLAGLIRTDGAIDGALAARTARVREEHRTFTYLIREGNPRIAITQHDVRAIQLAKAALYAGAKLLMARLGVNEVDRIDLAGAFGSHIDPVHALVLGLVPDCVPERVRAVGNAAGHGARIALVNVAARREIEALVRRIEKIETAIEPAFQDAFVGAMGIPHRSDPFPRLSQVVSLPPRTVDDTPRRRGRRG